MVPPPRRSRAGGVAPPPGISHRCGFSDL